MFTIESTTDTGGDVLEIVAKDAAGNTVTAWGWVSATTNYFPPDAYDADGNRSPDIEPRAMTDDEIETYARGRVRELYPDFGAE